MENNRASSSSSPPDNYTSAQQSQWLQATLSDMNIRIKAMMALLEEESAGIENSDKRRLEFFQKLEEFNNSYCSLAKKYDQLKSKLCSATDSRSIPSSSKSNPDDRTMEDFSSCLDSIVRDPDLDCDDKELVKQLIPTELCQMKMNHDIREYHYNEKDDKGIEMMGNDFISIQDQPTPNLREGSSEQENTFAELSFQVTKLMEENLQQQAELAKRNIEKKVIINRLQLQLEQLKGENRDLQSCISCLKGGDCDKQFQMSKLRRVFSGKLFD